MYLVEAAKRIFKTFFKRQSSSPIPYKENCEICGKTFDSRIELLNHTHVIPNKFEVGIPGTINNKRSEDNKSEIPDAYKCRTCGRTFTSEYELENHHKSQWDDNYSGREKDIIQESEKRIENEKLYTENEGILTEIPIEDISKMEQDVIQQRQLYEQLRSNDSSISTSDAIPVDHGGNITNIGSGCLRYDKFPGKIGYVPRGKKCYRE